MAQQARPEPKGQSEFFWAQVMNRSALVRRNGDLSSGSLIAPPELEGPGPPGVDVAEEQDGQEDQDLDQAEQAQLVVDDGPGEEEEGLDLEDDENEGQEVEADRGRLAGRRRGRVDAALVGLALVSGRAPAVANESDEAEQPDRENDRDNEEEKEGPIISHGRRPPGVLFMPQLRGAEQHLTRDSAAFQ